MRPIVPAILLAIGAPVAAQETRIAPPDHVSPAAEIEQMAWLAGQWDGTGIGGNRAMESWLPQTDDTMIGTFVQTTNSGGINFSEHMYLTEREGSLVLLVKHFGADMAGWEEREEMLTFRLVAIEPCAAFFHALTLRCDGEDGLVAAVRMRSDGDEVNELVFRFNRSGPDSASRNCTDAATTIDMNQCLMDVMAQAEERQAEYLGVAVERASERPELAAMIGESDAAFTAYRDAECGAVLQDWIEGSIRGAMTLNCRIELTDRRTHTIWQNWITHMDSTPPLLPEPEPTR